MSRARPGAARLAAGCHLFRAPAGSWRCALPDDRFIRVQGSDALLRRLQRHLHGQATDLAAEAEAADLVEQLAQRGLLATEADGSPAGRKLTDRIVHVEGDNPVAELTAELLGSQVRVVRGRIERDSFADLDMAVSCAGWLPDARWRQIDSWSTEHGVGWHRVHAEGRRFVLGPCSWRGRTASYADSRARRVAAARLPDELVGHWVYLDMADDLPAVPWPSPGGVALIAGLLVSDVLACLSGRPVPTEGHQLEVDPASGSIRRHPVLPLPNPQPPTADGVGHDLPLGTTSAAEQLVDPRLGLITRVTREDALPGTLRSCVAYTAHVAATRRFSSWSADPETSGAAFGDQEAARRAAIGEAVERYCGNAVPEPLAMTSFTKLVASSRRAIDPTELALYSDRQYRTPAFPFVPLTCDLDVAWVPGRDLGDGAETLVPASLVYLNYHRAGHAGGPATNVQAFAGIAAGTTVAAAIRSALEELLERDAVTMWWTSGAPATRVEVPPGSRLSHLLADPADAGLDVSVLQIPSSFGVPVLGAYLVDAEHRVVALGTACRASPQAAALKALTEAVASYRLSLELLDPHCAFWEAVEAGRIDPAPYHPFRADRCYRESFRDDWRDVHDLSMHLQIYLDPRMQDKHLTRLSAPPTATSLPDLPDLGSDPLPTYLDMLLAQGRRPVAVDLTTRDVAAAGLRVMRVVVPGLYSSAPAAFPLLGGRRLYCEPVERGWLPRPLTEETIVRAPIPFA